MTRIMCVGIIYRNETHQILVSLTDTTQGRFFHLQLLDDELYNIFGAFHIRYMGINGYKKIPELDFHSAQAIFEKITEAIERKIQKEYKAA